MKNISDSNFVRGGDKDVKLYRVTASVNLVKQLQRLFAMMIRGNKKYVDPTSVLNTVVDDMGLKYNELKGFE